MLLATPRTGPELEQAKSAVDEAVAISTGLLMTDPTTYLPLVDATQEAAARVLDGLGQHESADRLRAWLRSLPSV